MSRRDAIKDVRWTMFDQSRDSQLRAFLPSPIKLFIMAERMEAFINPEITGGSIWYTLACTADVHERNASPRRRNHYAIITNLTAAYFCGTGETAECVIRRGMPLEKNYAITEEERGLIIRRIFFTQTNKDIIHVRQKIVRGYKNILDMKCFHKLIKICSMFQRNFTLNNHLLQFSRVIKYLDI